MAKIKPGLGKGIDLLIPEEVAADVNEEQVLLKISMIEPNRNQPRKQFDEASLEELADSIKQYGIIQPLVVCKKDDFYEIIAGERRWRAAKKAGLKEVPVVIRDYSENEIAAISLIENIQREDLNPIDEAMGYKKLIDDFNLTQEEVAQKVSKSRTAVTNSMRLLKLGEDVQKMVISGELSAGHARALLGLESEELRCVAAKEIVDRNLSVRQTEDLVKRLNQPAKQAPPKKVKNDFLYKDLEKQIGDFLGTKVKINQKEKGKGRIEISYFSEEDLDRILNLINK